jgi:hypothetical protein
VRLALSAIIACASLVAGSAGCGRVPLDLAWLPGDAAPAVEHPRDLAADVAPDVVPDVVQDMTPDLAPDVAPDLLSDLPPDHPPDLSPDLPPDLPMSPIDAGPVCHPQPETCNGVDDDCDGKIDQDLPAIPCPGGGSRYCVSGRYSECPTRCEVCVPGSERQCFTSFCTFWGTQACASDGRSFGSCKESNPPTECEAVAKKNKKTAELEQCCIDNGYCCVDEFDLDHDGDHSNMVGRCDAVMCEP